MANIRQWEERPLSAASKRECMRIRIQTLTFPVQTGEVWEVEVKGTLSNCDAADERETTPYLSDESAGFDPNGFSPV